MGGAAEPSVSQNGDRAEVLYAIRSCSDAEASGPIGATGR